MLYCFIYYINTDVCVVHVCMHACRFVHVGMCVCMYVCAHTHTCVPHEWRSEAKSGALLYQFPPHSCEWSFLDLAVD